MPTTFKITPNSLGNFDYFTFHGNIDAQAEAQLKELPRQVRHPVVKFDMLGLAGFDLELVNGPLSEFHGTPVSGKNLGRLKLSSQVFPSPHLAPNN